MTAETQLRPPLDIAHCNCKVGTSDRDMDSVWLSERQILRSAIRDGSDATSPYAQSPVTQLDFELKYAFVAIPNKAGKSMYNKDPDPSMKHRRLR